MSREIDELKINNKGLFVFILVGVTLFSYGMLYKLPFIHPNMYSDVAFIYLREYHDRGHAGLVPNWDFDFEYPAVVAVVIFLTERASVAFPFLLDAFNTFVFLNGLLQLILFVGTLFILWQLQSDSVRFYTYFVGTVSFAMYSFYNWDMFVVFFVTLSLFLYLRKGFWHGKELSAVSLGLAIASKFIPVIMLPVLIQALKPLRLKLTYLGITVGSWLLVNAPFMLHNMERWLFTYRFVADFQSTNTWLNWFLDPIRDRAASHYLALGLITMLIYIVLRVKRPVVTKIECSWLAWFGAIYLFEPQMFIEMMPIVVLGAFPILAWRIADLLNGGIIIFYFIRETHPELPDYLLNQIMGFGLVNSLAAVRQLIVLLAFFWLLFPWLFSRSVYRKKEEVPNEARDKSHI